MEAGAAKSGGGVGEDLVGAADLAGSVLVGQTETPFVAHHPTKAKTG